MTPNQIALVQTSFARVAPIAATAADLFYGRLFEVAPQVRSLFPEDLRERAGKQFRLLDADPSHPSIQLKQWVRSGPHA